MSGENINLLSEFEWRTIHNALSVYQVQERKFKLGQRRVNEIQQLMDKVRDNYIAPYDNQNRT